jgi:cellulose synthase A
VDGDDDEDDIDDLDNEFNYAQGTSNARRQWQGDDPDLSSSSRHESQQPIPLLTNGQSVGNLAEKLLNITHI